MRNKVREFTRTVTVTTTVSSVQEDFKFYNKNKSAKMVQGVIECFDADGVYVDEREFTVEGEDYALLMSASPEFAPNKPADDFRDEDLWHILDLKESGG